MGLQPGFDFEGGHVLAAHLQHVLLAPEEADAPVLVQRAQVARVEPAIGVEAFGVLLRGLVVALEEAVAAHPDLAATVRLVDGRARLRLADLQLDAGQGASGGDGALLRRVVGVAEGGHAPAFRQPVGVRVLHGGQGRVDAAQGVGRGHVVHQADAREGVRVALRMVQQGRGDGREGGEADGGAFVAQLGEGGAGLEVREREVGRARVQAADEGQDGAHVEERQRIPEAVRLRQFEAVAAGGHGGPHQRLVAEGAALRVRRRARGVHHDGHVAQADARAGAVHRGLVHGLARGPEGVPPDHARGDGVPQQRHRAQQGRGLEREGGGVGGPGQPGQGTVEQRGEVDVLVDDVAREQHREVGVADHVGELALLVAGVDGHGPGAQHGRPEERFHELHAVGHEDAHAVARAHAEARQRARRPHRRRVQAGEAMAAVGEDDGVAVAEARGGAHGQVAEGRDLGPGRLRLRHAARRRGAVRRGRA